MFLKWLWKLCVLLLSRKVQFKFIGVSEPVLEACPGILGTEAVISFSGVSHLIFMVKAASGTYTLFGNISHGCRKNILGKSLHHSSHMYISAL